MILCNRNNSWDHAFRDDGRAIVQISRRPTKPAYRRRGSMDSVYGRPQVRRGPVSDNGRGYVHTLAVGPKGWNLPGPDLRRQGSCPTSTTQRWGKRSKQADKMGVSTVGIRANIAPTTTAAGWVGRAAQLLTGQPSSPGHTCSALSQGVKGQYSGRPRTCRGSISRALKPGRPNTPEICLSKAKVALSRDSRSARQRTGVRVSPR